MQRNSRSNDFLRRRFLKSAGVATGLTGVAGCLGGDNSSSSTPEGDNSQEQDNSDAGSQETGPESEPEDFETPESEHMDTQTLVENWGTTYSGHQRVGVGSFSPSQISEEYDSTWIEEWVEEGSYSPLPFSHEDVPETVKQETPHQFFSNFVKVDQLPSGASAEDAKSSLEEEGYEIQGEVGDFSIYTTVDEKEARAVGDGKHIVAFNVEGEGVGPASNVHQEYLNDLLDNHQSEGSDLDEDIQDLLNTIEVRDTFTAYRDDDLTLVDYENFVSGIGGDQPVAGAVTVDIENGAKYAAWKFENEEEAQEGYEIKSGRHGDLSNGFTQVDQEGQYLTAAGGFNSEQAFESPRALEDPVI